MTCAEPMSLQFNNDCHTPLHLEGQTQLVAMMNQNVCSICSPRCVEAGGMESLVKVGKVHFDYKNLCY